MDFTSRAREVATGHHHHMSGADLKNAGINFIAVDFDMTLVDTHTEGRWSRSASELASHVRPCMRQLVHDALDNGIYVAVVTFSPQVHKAV